jgi:hypothetical protein
MLSIRKNKRNVLDRQIYNNRFGFYPRAYVAADALGDMDRAKIEAIQAVEAAKTEFICIKVKDGTVVDTFDTFDDAAALVQKHARQKKAKLQITNSLTGLTMEITEGEVA